MFREKVACFTKDTSCYVSAETYLVLVAEVLLFKKKLLKSFLSFKHSASGRKKKEAKLQ